MRRLFLVRHGPTHVKGMLGWLDRPADLSDTDGIARLSAHLPADATIVSSDLLRARQTADVLARGRRRLPHEPGLREMCFGEWEGRHHSDITRTHEALSRAFWTNPGEVAAPGGESWNAMDARVTEVLNRLAPRGDLIVVVHLGVILSQIARARDLPPSEALGQQIDPLSVTELHIGPEGARAVAINHRP